ncbi:uncharacterized protein LOC126782612 isoform X2 [Argentina anserina]|uniref:uncharacterized protein LOC126782612 isoform X2 n=1 Tax=Argentina anserina TaxID=57926 RepID=UPI00217627F7|nr:uncharacterized protein LOC126782612 isoform X2 [Potentilla anserina]
MKQQALNKKRDIITISGCSTQMKPNSSAVAEGKKRKNDCSEDAVVLGKLGKIQIPPKLKKQFIDDREFSSQLDKDFVGMDSSQLNETNKKGNRRIWTKEEESALLGILEDLVTKGYRHENGTFKSGTLSQVENALHKLFPDCGLKAKPHIESKMKILKRQFHIVYEMVNKAGFKWNNEKKCVMVDTEKTWKAYLKHHKEADGWRGKLFPLYDRLGYIFKADCKPGERCQTSPDTEELNCFDVDTTDYEIEKNISPKSVDQVTTKQTDLSHSSPSKRRRDASTRGSSHINETDAKSSRDFWTKEEEDAVLRILEDLVAKGLLYDNGTFRANTFSRIENALRRLCPASGLEARHIESKVKEWKRECSIVCDMLSRTGFGWNDVMKCVEVDSGETWKAYVQNQREADKWRGKVGKHFPNFDRLAQIFDVDCETVKTSSRPAEILEEINCFEINSTDIGIEEDTCPRSAEQLITKQTDCSSSPEKRRRREDDTGGSSHTDEPIIRSRRRWTKEEEDALLGILEDLVAKGHRYEKGTFRSGTSALIEDALSKLCPNSGLKVRPHVESKIKKWKQECSIVCDMLNTEGFSWNNEMKCVEVDTETWKRYVKHHKGADKWRGKSFPLFDRLIYIFQMGHLIGKTNPIPAYMVEKMNCIEFNTTSFGTSKDACSKAVEQVSTTKDTDQSHTLPSKRREDCMGGTHPIKETKRKGRRRKWTGEEEDKLLGILEDLVAKGHHFHNRTFTCRTLTLIENALCNLCPVSGLKAYPHIESKLKKLKKGFRTVCDILNSGFGWNDRTNCVVVECEESWKGFVQTCPYIWS